MYVKGDAKNLLEKLYGDINIVYNDGLSIKECYRKIISEYYSNGDIDSITSFFLTHVMNLFEDESDEIILKEINKFFKESVFISSLDHVLESDQVILSIDKNKNNRLI